MERFILVVDDEVIVKDMIVSFFTRIGYKVVTASSGNKAIKEIGINPDYIGLVMTDCNVSDGTGIHVIEFVKEKHPKIPVILMSADPSNETNAKILRAEFLLKPFNSLAEVGDLVAKLFRKE